MRKLSAILLSLIIILCACNNPDEVRGLFVEEVFSHAKNYADVEFDELFGENFGPHYGKTVSTDRIVIVKVTEVIPRTVEQATKNAMLSRARVLSDIKGEGDKEITIVQNMATDMRENQFLREGGVYVLPLSLSQSEHNDGLYLIHGEVEWHAGAGYYYMLFEVDDKGILHSHSTLLAFNKFDGKPYTELVDEILALY